MTTGSQRPELGEVLGAVLDSIASAASVHDPSSGEGIVIEEATIELPLEGYLVVEGGRPVLRTGLPQTSMQTGFVAPVHRGRLHVALVELPSHE
jgi:hypothetical protein